MLSGSLSLIGSFASFQVLQGCFLTEANLRTSIFELSVIWLLVILLSSICHVYFTTRKARQTGQPAWSRLTRLILYAFSPPFIIGSFLTLFLVWQQKLIWIPGIWMICYGLAVWSAALFSIMEPRWLGLFMMLTGLMTLFAATSYGLVLLAVSFGCFHLIYGIRIYIKYGG